MQLAQAALLIGKDAEGADLLARAHQAFLSRGRNAARRPLRILAGLHIDAPANSRKAGGWLSRASRLLDGQPDCVENGYLLLPEGYRSFHAGDAVTAHAMFVQAAAFGERFATRIS